MNQFELFAQLHYANKPFLLPNAWDAGSAALMEAAGYKAVATSSAALAQALGYEDGQQIPFGLLLETVKRIRRKITVPLTVDMERGYAMTIPALLQRLDKMADAGVSGINIEDSNEKRELKSAAAFQQVVFAISNHFARRHMPLFVNVRTDAYVVKKEDALDETIKRAQSYEAAGANGIFVPFLTDMTATRKIVKATSLPVSVFFSRGLAGYELLAAAGIKRISMGNALYKWTQKELTARLQLIQESRSGDSLFEETRKAVLL